MADDTPPHLRTELSLFLNITERYGAFHVSPSWCCLAQSSLMALVKTMMIGETSVYPMHIALPPPPLHTS